ncbi:MAG: hypothetical protein K2X93_17900 [Candidatus Obscuribacterales bacterium]|nr:hypothetical protein [Candidatus Obscuribacterales bacterium]
MKVKGAKALATRVRSSNLKKRLETIQTNEEATSDNDLSFDPLEQMSDAIVELAVNGEFEFLDPIGSPPSAVPDFQQLFSHQMMIEFGTENGMFLLERFNSGKVSPKLRKQIEAIRDYTAGVFRRQYLSKNARVLETVANLYRKAYHDGGLGEVDKAITMTNTKLMLNGSRFGIGPGTACMEGDNGTTEWIAVIFSDLHKEEFVSLEWCHLLEAPVF